MKIYEINTAVRAALEQVYVDEETGELIGTESLDAVTEESASKIANTSRWLREEEAEIEAMKQAERSIADRRKAKEKRLDWLKQWTLKGLMAIGGKVEEADIRVSTRKSETVKIEDEATLDPAFLVVKTTTAPNKKALKDALKAGQEIAGVSLVTNYNLAIK